MNKCEHGQKITLFCATDCCVWKEAAGCQACMKKYHNHMGTKVFLGEEEVISIVKKYTMDSSIKPKCRLLQEAIYSYFNLLKGQLTASLDAACKNIINQIGYPYLYANNTLSTYKRLKNKEYKKLLQKDFKSLYEVTQKITDKELVNEQAKIYLNQMKLTEDLIKGLEGMIKNYQTMIKKYHSSFVHEPQHYDKITEIFKNLYSESPRSNQTKLKEEKKISSPVYQFKNQLQDKQDKTVKLQELISPEPMGRIPAIGSPPSLMRPNYSRDVSIDNRIVKQHKFAGGIKMQKQKSQKQLLPVAKGLLPREKSERIENVRQQINTKELQINEKKKVLIEMMKQKEDSIKNVKARIEANTLEMKNKYLNEKKQEHLSQAKTQQISEQIVNKAQQIKITVYETQTLTHDNKKFSQSSKSTNRMSFPVSSLDQEVVQKSSGDMKEIGSISGDKSQSNSQSQLDLDTFKQTNDIQNYAFTTLPIEQSLPKRTVEPVQRKLIVITTDRLNQTEPQGATSPILKLKGEMDRKEANRMQDSMVEKKLFADLIKPTSPVSVQKKQHQQLQQPQRLLQLIPIYHKKTETMLQLKENEQKSLALLLKCLPLKGEEAVVYLQRAIDIAENNLSAAEYLSYLYLDLDRPLDCLKLCNKMIQRIENSNQPQELLLIISNNKAAALNVLGRYSESIVLLERCLRCRQKDYFFKNLGDAYISISIYQKAIYNYQKCLRLNDQYDEAHYNLAVCLYVQQNYHNAKLSIQKAIQINSINESYHELLNNIETRINHY